MTRPTEHKGSVPSSMDDVASIRAALASGDTTAEEITRSALERVAARNGTLNAIIYENPAALETAREIDRRRAGAAPLGPLAGVPVVVKDTMDMAGFPTTAGWRLLHGPSGGVELRPERDSPVVARLRASDAVILGKTNVPVLSWTGTHANDSWAGPTLNAAIANRVPGGSSAGTATAVASGMCVLGLAEETGGSIQNPAAAQGLVGIKPTIGLVPNAGVMPLSANRDVVGPIARTVTDAAHGLDVLAGFDAEDPKTLASVGRIPHGGYAQGLSPDGLQGRRIGLYGPGWRPDALSPETASLYEAAKDRLEAAGAILVEDPFAGTDFAGLRQITPGTPFFDGRGLESVAYDLGHYLRRLGPDGAIASWSAFAEAVREEDPFAEGGVLSYLPNLPDFRAAIATPEAPPVLHAFVTLKARYLKIVDEVFARHALDSLVYPQAVAELPALHSGDAIHETTVGELNISGMPGIALPSAAYTSGAPFSLIFLGPLWSEAELVGQTFAFERAENA